MANAQFEKMNGFSDWLTMRGVLSDAQKQKWLSATLDMDMTGDLPCPAWYNFVLLPVAWSWIAEEEMFRRLAEFLELSYLEHIDIQGLAHALIPVEFARNHQIIPVKADDDSNTIYVATAAPFKPSMQDDLEFLTDKKIVFQVASPTQIKAALDKYYPAKDEKVLDFKVKNETGLDAPVVRLVNLILIDAVRRRASEIHFEARADQFCVRYRLDGLMQTMMLPPIKLRQGVFKHIKTMAKIDLEKKSPQTGRIILSLGQEGRMWNFDVAVMPCLHGERMVIRVCGSRVFELDELGLTIAQIAWLRQERGEVDFPGLMVVVGAHDAGKTTFVNAFLADIVKCKRNEQPVIIAIGNKERATDIAGVTFVRIEDLPPVGFHRAIAQVVESQRPDILVLDDLDDAEKIGAAVAISVQVHKVIAKMTVDFAGQPLDFSQFFIGPTKCSASVWRVTPLRRLCDECKEETKQEGIDKRNWIEVTFGSDKLYDVFNNKEPKFYMARGCANCGNTGYRGFVYSYARRGNREDVLFCAMEKLKTGETTVNEIWRQVK